MKNLNTKTVVRRAPMLRSSHWAFLIGAVGGSLLGIFEAYSLAGGLGWAALGGLIGALLGIVVGCDLLIPGPPPRSGFEHDRGSRVGPFRWGTMLLFVLVEGLLISAYLWGGATLVCQRLETQIDCQRTVMGWFNSRPIGETVYDNVIGVAMDVHNEVLIQHGPFQQSQSAPGFEFAEMQQIQAFLVGQSSELTLIANSWWSRLAVPVCLTLTLLCAVWTFFSLRSGLKILREQFALGEVYWGWRQS